MYEHHSYYIMAVLWVFELLLAENPTFFKIIEE
jgi:hypothetical protein